MNLMDISLLSMMIIGYCAGRSSASNSEKDAGDGYQCENCGKVFAYRYYRDKHMKYTRCIDHGDRQFPCQLCNR